MILLNHYELSLSNRITKDSIELWMSKKADLSIVSWLFYFLKGRFHFQRMLWLIIEIIKKESISFTLQTIIACAWLLLKSLLNRTLLKRRGCLCLGLPFQSFLLVRISQYYLQITLLLVLVFKLKWILFFTHRTCWIFCACPFCYLFLKPYLLSALKTNKNQGG